MAFIANEIYFEIVSSQSNLMEWKFLAFSFKRSTVFFVAVVVPQQKSFSLSFQHLAKLVTG